jgi:hypothetical protein
VVGALRVTARQNRVIAPDFRSRSLGVIEEVEVMNGHDTCSPAAWDQQRMHRMRDVNASAEGFDRGPLESMPGVVEHAHRDARIDGACSGYYTAIEPILPRAREQRERIGTPEVTRERDGHFVDVLADARPLPERRAIVEEDAHARAS